MELHVGDCVGERYGIIIGFSAFVKKAGQRGDHLKEKTACHRLVSAECDTYS